MAGSFNRVLVGGALTRAPRLRFLEDGTAEASFGLLLERDADPVIPLEVRCHGLLAERVVSGLERGGQALIAGTLSRSMNSGENTTEDLVVVAHEVLAL